MRVNVVNSLSLAPVRVNVVNSFSLAPGRVNVVNSSFPLSGGYSRFTVGCCSAPCAKVLSVAGFLGRSALVPVSLLG